MAITAKKILLISSGQPSLNPRLVKEADALVENGYQVKVIYQYWNKWGTDLDTELIAQKKWVAIRVGGDPLKEKTSYLLTRLQFKFGQNLLKLFGLKDKFAELAIGRCTCQLANKASKTSADLYIAHNLAALPAAVIAAKKNKAKCGFDAEDFHRNEVSNNPLDLDVSLKKYIEDKYIMHTDYISTSSSLISQEYQKLYPIKTPYTILNVFPTEKNNLNRDLKKLKLFWFSQNIGKNRGLEEVIKALKQQENIELHLLGNCDHLTKKYFKSFAEVNSYNAVNIFYHDPIPSDKIIQFASQFDLGLATEIGFPLNRDICLTNKIFTYIQAGLAIIASDTKSQLDLLIKYPNMGMTFEKNNSDSLAHVIKSYVDDQKILYAHQKQAKKYADEELNWDIEKEKFLSIVKQILEN